MIFNNNQPIYAQIADRLADEILVGTYLPNGRVPGVRDYSARLEVNVNTTVKAFDLLAQAGVLYSKRGMGYFVSPEAHRHILQTRKEEFYRDTLPGVFRRMKQLGISAEELTRRYNEYLHS